MSPRLSSVIVVLVPIALALGQRSEGGAPAGSSPSTAQVIERYIESSGGSALAQVRTEIRKGRLRRLDEGLVPFEIVAKAPGKWRYTQRFAWGEAVSYGSDGSSAWVQDNRGVADMPLRQRFDLDLMLDIQAPLRMRKMYPELTVIGSEMADGKDAVVVQARSPDGAAIELAFDQETGLLARAGEVRFKDYRRVGEIQRPYLIVLGDDRLQLQFSEILLDVDAADSQFERPACPLPQGKPLFFVERQRAEVSAEAVQACAGEYRLTPDQVLRFIAQGSHLFGVDPKNRAAGFAEVFPVSDTEYFREFENIEYHFRRDSSGKVTHVVVIRKDGSTETAERIK